MATTRSKKLKRPTTTYAGAPVGSLTAEATPAAPKTNSQSEVTAFNDPNYRVPDTAENRAITAVNAAQPPPPQGKDLDSQRAFNTQTVGATAIGTEIEAAKIPAIASFQQVQQTLAGGSPLAPTGTTRTPTVQESLAAFGGQVAPQGFGGAFTNSPMAVTSNRPGTAPGVTDMGGGVRSNPSKVEIGADQATDALGPVPQVDIGLADRRLGEYQEALGMSREVIDRLLNGPNTAARIGSQTLRTQLALARSAAGGPGAVQQAFSAAQQQAPALQAAAQQQATAEELQKVTAAGNVASNFAQAALGARGQDVDIAKKNAEAGLAVKDMVTRLTGTQLEMDQRNQELIGQMARDIAAMEFDWTKLSVEQQDAALDRYLEIYGIDANIRAQIKLQRDSGKITSRDWLSAGASTFASGSTVLASAVGAPPV